LKKIEKNNNIKQLYGKAGKKQIKNPVLDLHNSGGQTVKSTASVCIVGL